MAASSSSAAGVLVTPSSFTHALTVKLDDTNFRSWRQQVSGVIRTHHLQRFIENPDIPPRFLTEEDRVAADENPAYTAWIQQDSALFTWLLSSLSESVLPTVVNCTRSWQIWSEILGFFQAQAQAQSTMLRTELKNV